MTDIFGKRIQIDVVAEGAMARRWCGGREGELRIQFEVEKSQSAEPNSATFTITNLNEKSRGFLAASKGAVARIVAGFTTSAPDVEEGYARTLDILCTGNITKVESMHDGTDWTTMVEIEDGRKALNTRVDASFSPGAGGSEIINKIIDAAKGGGVSEGFVTELVGEVRKFGTGLAASGSVSDVLKKVLGGTGVEFSVQDGALQFIDADGATDDPVVLLDQSSGLVGSPERKDDGLVGAISKLKPQIRPGRRFRLVSRTVTGLLVCQSVRHLGDTHGDSWETEIEAR